MNYISVLNFLSQGKALKLALKKLWSTSLNDRPWIACLFLVKKAYGNACWLWSLRVLNPPAPREFPLRFSSCLRKLSQNNTEINVKIILVDDATYDVAQTLRGQDRIFFRLSFRNCISCVLNYDDLLLHLFLNSTVQIYEIHMFIISNCSSVSYNR